MTDSLAQGKRLHVVAAVLTDDRRRVLISRRPADRHQGGRWEFPGGKVEGAEAPLAALTRELREELGITVQAARPLIQIPHDYPDRRVWLDVWWVEAWNGEPRGLEGQPIRWVKIEDLDVRFLPAADAPVITAIRLPSVYLISPEPGLDHERFLHSLAGCLQSGIRLVQLRAKQLDGSRYRELARRTLELCKSYHATLLLNAEPSLTMALGADGVHLSSERLLTVRKRPLGQECWVGASCHSPQELAHACCIDVDFAVLSPVSRTASHPTASPLGWARFQALVAAATIPVYALGGMGIADLRTAWGCGAQGIAASSAIWLDDARYDLANRLGPGRISVPGT